MNPFPNQAPTTGVGSVSTGAKLGRFASPTGRRHGAKRSPLARLRAALQGEKHAVDAYPPAESPAKER
jgi:hypothetical protein